MISRGPLQPLDAPAFGLDDETPLSTADVGQLMDQGMPGLMLPADAPTSAARAWTVFALRADDRAVAPRLIIADLPSAVRDGLFEAPFFASAIHEQIIDAWPGGQASGADRDRAGAFYLNADMETIIRQISAHSIDIAGSMYRQAKLQELICLILSSWRRGELLPADTGESLDASERQRLAVAHRLIETRFDEKLTIDEIGRHCGMSRAKLTQGFRMLFRRSIAEVLAERRMAAAAVALRSTNLPVSRIAFQSGYHSNAAFARAFARRYGSPPTGFRRAEQELAIRARTRSPGSGEASVGGKLRLS
jgi:AraC-like DNA-binding protein